jgi:hypothetical protein
VIHQPDLESRGVARLRLIPNIRQKMKNSLSTLLDE